MVRSLLPSLSPFPPPPPFMLMLTSFSPSSFVPSVVKNLSAFRPREGPPGGFGSGANFGAMDDFPKHRQPDQGILDHEKKRQVEVRCAELTDELEEKRLVQPSLFSLLSLPSFSSFSFFSLSTHLPVDRRRRRSKNEATNSVCYSSCALSSSSSPSPPTHATFLDSAPSLEPPGSGAIRFAKNDWLIWPEPKCSRARVFLALPRTMSLSRRCSTRSKRRGLE